jgi:hypothetical protein
MNTKSARQLVLHLWLILVVVCFLTDIQTNLSAAQNRQATNGNPITLQVDTFIDSNNKDYQVCSPHPNDCSLRGAISKTNSVPTQAYIIQLPAGTYELTRTGAGEDSNKTGDLDLYGGNLTITGSGIDVTQINGNMLDRVLQIHDQAFVVVQWLTITGGQLPDGLTPLEMSGGGVFNNGIFVLDAAAITNNTAGAGISGEAGGDGGGIYNSGTLTLSSYSKVSNNTAGNGGSSGDLNVPGGNGGNGGGIYNIGSLFIQNSSLSENTAGQGGMANFELLTGRKGGDGGNGGGIYSDGTLTIFHSSLTWNASGNGGGGGDGDACIDGPITSEDIPPTIPLISDETNGDGGNGGAGGAGGAIYSMGSLELDSTLVANNHAGSGARGGVGWIFGGTGGEGGKGGGISHYGILRLLNSQVWENQAGNGGDGGMSCYKAGPSGGAGGYGGGIVGSGTFTIQNSDVTHNMTGYSGSGGFRGGSGGGIHFDTGEFNIFHSHVNDNTSIGGDGGGVFLINGKTNFIDSQVNRNAITFIGSGGGVYNLQGSASFLNSQVMMNTAGTGISGGEICGHSGCFCYDGGPGGDGGGIFNQGTLYLVYTFIENNMSGGGGSRYSGEFSCYGGPGGSGGGIANLGAAQMFYSQVSGNQTGSSGGANPVNVEVDSSGGGLFNTGNLIIEYSLVISNTTGDSTSDLVNGGGGIYSSGTLSMNGVSLLDNQAGTVNYGGFGGGLFITNQPETLANLIIANNRVMPGGKGCGVYVDRTSLDLLHTTLARTTGGDGSGIQVNDSNVVLTNTILVSQSVGITATAGSVVTLQNILLGDGEWANLLDFSGEGNFNYAHILTGDPVFLAPDLGNYHIGLGSTAIDRGSNTSITTDLDEQPRPNPGTNLPDLGADEYWDFTPISEVTLSGPISGTIYTPVSITAAINPVTATPNIIYIWTPWPYTGQFTPNATFSWPEAGVYTVTLIAMNMGSQVQSRQVIAIWAGEPIRTYLPIVIQSGNLP